MTGDRSSLGRATVIGSALLMCAAFVLALKVGPIPIDLWAALLSFGSAPNDPSEVREQIVLYDIRLPRAVLAVLVGGGLALSGALMQGLFRNPLAEPGIVGVSSGAAFAAIFVIVLGGSLAPGYVAAFGGFAIPVAAFFGSLITLFVLYGISTRSGQTSVATMLLAGIAITALANAATGIFVFISTDQQLRDLTFWTLGSLGGATWDKVFVSSLFIAPAAFASLLIGRGLNGLLLGEAEAFHLGIDTQRLKRIIMVIVACAAGAAVAVAGIIGFVGIVVPHLLRLLIGADHRFLVPSSIMVGGTLLLLADMVARTIVTPAELPIGIVTALIGAPFFLWLLLKRRVALDV